MQEEKRKQKIRVCPHCQKLIEIVVRTLIEEVLPYTQNDEAADPLIGLTDSQRHLIEQARSAGILQEFERVVRLVKSNELPRSYERFFLVFLRTAVTKAIPRFALQFFVERFRSNRDLQFWSSQGIGAVVARGKLCAFVPSEYVIGRKSNNGKIIITTHAQPGDLTRWFVQADSTGSSLERTLDFSHGRVRALEGS